MKVNKGIIVLLVLSVIGTLLIYSYLPSTIPLHWDFKGEVDRMGSKNFVFLTALLPLAIYLLMVFLPKIDPKRESYQKHKKAYDIFKVAIVLFLMVMHWVSILIALGYDLDMKLIVSGGVGVLFILIGNYMGQIRHNYFFGIKTPWTLSSEKVWKKTHRAGSYVFVLLGVLFIATAFMKGMLVWIINLGGVLILVPGLFVYSYWVYKKEIQSKK